MYADYTFYATDYAGDVLTADNSDKWLTRASRKLDVLTFGRLRAGYPNDVDAAVKMACCAVADALCLVDTQAKAGMAAIDAATGKYTGQIAGIHSGNESITYARSRESTIYGRAAADAAELNKLIYAAAAEYLSGVCDSSGVNLLYAGVR